MLQINDVMWAVRTCFDKRPLNDNILSSLRNQGVDEVNLINDYRLGQPVTTASEFFETKFIPSDKLHLICVEDDAILSDCFVKESLHLINRVADDYGAINFSVDASAYYIDSNTVYIPSVDMFRRKREIHYTGSVAISKSAAIEFCKKYSSMQQHGKSFDLKLSNVCLDAGMPHYLCFPTLSKSSNIESSLGNTLKPKDDSFTHLPFFTKSEEFKNSPLSMQKNMILTVKKQQQLYYG